MNTGDFRRVPREQIGSVVKELYNDAHRIGWEHLPLTARTAQYDQWVTDAKIGGVLTRYMSSENARSWIKDGPMKEYNRARLGAGRYAQFGSASSLQVEHLIAHIFESSTSIVEGSQGVKPFHCLVIADGLKTYMAWDLARNLRYLVWASVNYLADHPQDSACIVLLETMEHPIPYAEKLRHARIAERFSIKIGYYRMDHQRMVGGDQL